MPVNAIFSYLVPPHPTDGEAEALTGTIVPLQGDLFRMLRGVFDKAEEECRTPIRFLPDNDGAQTNLVRGFVVDILRTSSLDACEDLANRLRDATDKRSGLGLLFLIIGSDGDQKKVVLSRFPVDEGVLAELSGQQLHIEFVERIFMRNSSSYKAALYKGVSLASDFWDGAAVDKQIAGTSGAVANYWVKNFLLSDLKTTSASGSRMLATVLRKASSDKKASLVVKRELSNAVGLIGNLKGARISLAGVMDRYSLTEATRDVIDRNIPNERFKDSEFILDAATFNQRVAVRSVRLNNGVTLSAPTSSFDEVFEMERLSGEKVRFTTVGSIVDEKMKARA